MQKTPEIKIDWKRFTDQIKFNQPNIFYCVGNRSTGKSTLLELLASKHPKIIDVFGGRDNESLIWLNPKSPYKTNLVITGKNYKTITLQDIENHDAILSSPKFFTLSQYKKFTKHIFTILSHRTHWKTPWAMIIRNIPQMPANEFIYYMRESRMCGVTKLIETTQHHQPLEEIADYTLIKKLGINLGNFAFIQHFTDLQNLQNNQFTILSNSGAVGVGTFALPKWRNQKPYKQVI